MPLFSSIPSDLDGGVHGHLGLGLDDASYFAFTNEHYVRPVHPGPSNIQPGTAHHEAICLRDEHATAIRVKTLTLKVP